MSVSSTVLIPARRNRITLFGKPFSKSAILRIFHINYLFFYRRVVLSAPGPLSGCPFMCWSRDFKIANFQPICAGIRNRATGGPQAIRDFPPPLRRIVEFDDMPSPNITENLDESDLNEQRPFWVLAEGHAGLKKNVWASLSAIFFLILRFGRGPKLWRKPDLVVR